MENDLTTTDPLVPQIRFYESDPINYNKDSQDNVSTQSGVEPAKKPDSSILFYPTISFKSPIDLVIGQDSRTEEVASIPTEETSPDVPVSIEGTSTEPLI